MTDRRYNRLVAEYNAIQEDLRDFGHNLNPVTFRVLRNRQAAIQKLLDLADAASGQEAPAELQEF